MGDCTASCEKCKTIVPAIAALTQKKVSVRTEVWVKNRRGVILWCNDDCSFFLNMPCEEIIGKRAQELFPIEQAVLLRNIDELGWHLGKYETVINIPEIDGAPRHCLKSVEVVKWNEEDVLVGTIVRTSSYMKEQWGPSAVLHGVRAFTQMALFLLAMNLAEIWNTVTAFFFA